MKKIRKMMMILFISIMSFVFFGIKAEAATYEFKFLPYNVTTACDLDNLGDDGSGLGQGCFRKYLNGELDSFAITNGIVAPGQKIMLVQMFVPDSSNSTITSLNYAVRHDPSKVTLHTNNVEGGITLSYGMIVGYNENIEEVNFGYKYGPNGASTTDTYFPIGGSGITKRKNWNKGGDPNLNDISTGLIQGFLFKDSKTTDPLVKPIPLSATFYTINDDVAAGSTMTFTYPKIEGNRALTSVSSFDKSSDTLTLTPLTLSVLSDVSSDGTLSSLTATGTALGTEYNYFLNKFVPADATKLEYDLVVPNSVSSLNFEGTPVDSHIKGVIGIKTDENVNGGLKSLVVGNNSHNIVVTAESGDITTYKINIKRLSNDATISSITGTNDVEFPAIVSNTDRYAITVPYKTSSTFVNVSTTHENATVSSGAGSWVIPVDTTNYNNDKTTIFAVKIGAENCSYTTTQVPGNVCTEKNYTFDVTRKAASKNVKLSSLKVDNVLVPDFSPTKYEYTLDDVNFDKQSVNVTATVEDSLNSIIDGTGVKTLNVGDNKIKVIVKSESQEENVTQEYIINIRRLSNENALQSLTVSQVINPAPAVSPSLTPSFGATKYEYSYTYDPDATGVTISATAKDTGKAKVSILDTTTDSTGIELVAPTLNSASFTVTTSVKQVTVVVTPEDSSVSPKRYVIDLKRQLGNDNYLSSLSINPGTINETFQSSVGTYTAIVDADVTSVDVNAVLRDPKARIVSITGNSGFQFGPGNIITVTVQSETGINASDNTTGINTYTINVTRKKYDIATLSDVKVGFGVAAKSSIMSNFVVKQDEHGVDYYEAELYTQNSPLPYLTKDMDIEFTLANEYATFTSSMNASYINGNTYGKDNVAVNTGDNTYTISVKSHDEAKTLNYVIKVYRQKNTDNASGIVSVANVTAEPEEVADGEIPKNYYVTLPNSKEVLSPSEVVIGIPTGATLQKNTGTLNLSTQSENLFNYSITSEDGVAENYVIHITRTKSNNANMTTVYLKIGDDASRSCVVAASSVPGKNPGCTIEVPVSTTSYYLLPTIHSSASVNPTNDTEYIMDPLLTSDSVQERNLVVTAEDSTQKTYTITVKRALSADATLKSISLTDVTGGKNSPISGYSPITIQANKISYNVTVTGDVEDILISAVKNDNKATINTDLSQPISLSYGINQFTINTTAENGTTTGSYVLNITRNKKTDATLKDLRIESSTLTNFSGATTGYVYPPNGMALSYNTTQLNVLAHVNDDSSNLLDENAIIESINVKYNDETVKNIAITQAEEVTANIPLMTGKNVIEIKVAAQDRSQTKIYKITIMRSRNTDATIQKVEVYFEGSYHEATKQADGTYTITVPNAVKKAIQAGTTPSDGAVRVTPTSGATADDPLAMWTVQTTDLETLDQYGVAVSNNVLINVTPEEGTMVPYTLVVTRTPSSVKDMSSLNIYTNADSSTPKACIFKGGNIECQISAETSTTQLKMEATLVDDKSSVTYDNGISNGIVDGEWINIGPTETEKTIIATVKAEDGTTKPYTIKIKRQASADSYLKPIQTNVDDSLVFADIPDFRREKTSYTDSPLSVPGERTSVDIKLEVNDVRANIISIDGVAQADSTKSTTYTKNLVYGNNDVDIVVQAEDGVTRLTYTVRIVRKKKIDANLSDLQVTVDALSGTLPNFDAEDTTYPATDSYNVGYDYTSLNLYALVSDTEDGHAQITSITNSGLPISITAGKEVNTTIPLSTGDNSIEVTVTAHDTIVTKTYVININRAKNTDTSLGKVEVYFDGALHEAIWNETKNAYEIVVPYNTTVAQGTNVNVNGYVLVTPNHGKVSTDPKATVTMNNTSLLTNDSVNGNVNTHIFNVRAEAGNDIDYTLLITRTKNDKKVLEKVNVYKDSEVATNTYCTFESGVYSCDIDVPVGTNNITLEGILSSDSVDASVKFTKDTSEPKTYTNDYTLGNSSSLTITGVVTAEDGTTQDYVINITRAKSSTSTLEYIKTDASNIGTLGLITDPFNPLTSTYTINVPYNQTDLEIEAKAADPKAKVTIFKVIGGSSAEDIAADATNLHNISIPLETTGSATIVKIVVEPESGVADKRVYTITVNRGANEEARLSDIKIGSQSINDYLPDGVTFSPDGREYELEILDYEISSLLINGVNVDTEYGTIKVGEQSATPTVGVSVDIQTIHYNQTLPVTPPVSNPYVNTIVVKGVAQNTNVTKEYILKIKRKASTLTDIDGNGVGMNYGTPSTFHPATCDLTNLRCTITVPNDVTIADASNVVVTTANGNLTTDKKATVSMGSTNLVTNDPVNGNVNEHLFTVIAEDGVNKKDYTLVITREKSNNAVLNSILVYDSTGTNVIGSFNPSYDKTKPEGQQVYSVVVPVDTSEFKVYAEPEYPYVTITGATVDLTSAGSTGKYTLTESNRQVIVTSRSEDGSTTLTYTLNIKRVSNSNYYLGNLIIKGEDGNDYIAELNPAISDSVDEYTVKIPGTVNYVDLTVSPQSYLATVGFNGLTSDVDSENKVDGLNPDSDADTDDARYYIGTNSTKVVNFTITSEAGADKPYKLNIIREPRTDATLKTLTYTLPGGSIEILNLTDDPTKRDFVIDTPVENDITGINIAAQANDEEANVSGHIGDQIIATGANTYTITVTAEDGVTKENYTISIERKKNSDATLSALSVNGHVFNETFVPSDENHINYTMTVDTLKENLTAEEVIAIPTVTTSTVEKDVTVVLSKVTPTVYNITVTAEDKTTTLVYTITITRPKSSDCLLKSVTITGASLTPAFDKDVDSYTITVPYGSTNFTIASEANAPTSVVSANGNTGHSLNEGSFTVVVTAENGNTKNYNFTIAEAPSNDGKLTSLSVTNHTMTPAFTQTTYDYSIGNVENTYESLKVNAIPSNANSEIQYIHSGVEINECHNLQMCDISITSSAINESKTITVRITPPAGATYKQDYNVTYRRVRSSNAYLSSITASAGTFDIPFNKGTTNYVLSLPYENDSVDLTFTAENHSSSLEIDGTSAVVSPQTVTYDNLPAGGTKNVQVKVIAEDGNSTKVYNVVIKRAVYEGSSDAFLSDLSVQDYSFVGETFNSQDFDYTIGQIPYRLATLTINATPNDAHATIEYFLDGVKQSNNVINISNTSQTISVKVTSENRKVSKTYSIAYTKIAKNINDLSSIVVNPGLLTPRFNNNVQAYTVDVDSMTDSIDITAITADTSSTLKINNEAWVSGKVYTVNNLQPGSNLINITVTAENGTPKVYRVTIVKGSETEVITSIEYGHNIADGYIKTVADNQTVIDMKNQLDNDNAKLEIWSSDDTTLMSDSDIVGTGMIVKLIVKGQLLDSKKIIVKGDTTGDGVIDIFDSSDILNHYVGRIMLTGDALVAAEVYEDGIIDIYDSSDVLNHYVGRNLIVF